MSVAVILKIKHCRDCPFVHKEREYTGDSWDTEFEWSCKHPKLRTPLIIGIADWRKSDEDRLPIPKRCPLRKK